MFFDSCIILVERERAVRFKWGSRKANAKHNWMCHPPPDLELTWRWVAHSNPLLW